LIPVNVQFVPGVPVKRTCVFVPTSSRLAPAAIELIVVRRPEAEHPVNVFVPVNLLSRLVQLLPVIWSRNAFASHPLAACRFVTPITTAFDIVGRTRK
jgi:hypothetical protein